MRFVLHKTESEMMAQQDWEWNDGSEVMEEVEWNELGMT